MDINNNISEYFAWLKSRTFTHTDQETGWSVINTPFFGAFNDSIDIYVKFDKNKVILSDSGDTLDNLSLLGVNVLRSKTKQDMIDSILIQKGIKLLNTELVIETDVSNFAQAKHNLLTAILEINEFRHLTSTNVLNLFKEDVRLYLDSFSEINYTSEFIAKGQTGLEFTFDFQIAKKKEEVVLKSFNTVNKSQLSQFLFSWDDIKPVREKANKKEIRAVAVLNDTISEIKPEFIKALENKNADYILWSQRNSVENKYKLTA